MTKDQHTDQREYALRLASAFIGMHTGGGVPQEVMGEFDQLLGQPDIVLSVIQAALSGATYIDSDDDGRVLCTECDLLVSLDGCKGILLDDNGPGESPSFDGYVCQSCCERIEAAQYGEG